MAKNYTGNKDLNDVIRVLVEHGWTVEKKKHVKLKAPDGKFSLTCSSTPRCSFAYRKVISDIKRYGGYVYEELKYA